jgi:hypothetical protein
LKGTGFFWSPKITFMSGRAPFPNGDTDFNDYAAVAVPYLNTNASRLKIDPNDILQLNGYFTQWQSLFPLSQQQATRTTTISKKKDALRADMEKLLRHIYNDIPRSLPTTQDCSTLNLKKRGPRNPAHGKPASAPYGRLDKMTHLQHRLRVTDPLRPETQSKPKGVKFIEVWLALVPAAAMGSGVVPPASAFAHRLTTGRFLSTIDFHLDDVGKTAFYFTRWVSSRGVAGPDSEIFTAIVG